MKASAQKTRESSYPILPLLLTRTSSRALTPQTLPDTLLFSLFEAARWAPSSYNNQPWRFVYAKRESDRFAAFLDLLVPLNRAWAQDASLLVVVLSKKTFDKDGQPSRTHSFDTGAACENLALEGTSRGLVVHPMQGFDYARARTCVGAPEAFEVEVMIAIGFPDPLRQKEEIPTDRKSLDNLLFLNQFPS